MQAPTWVRDIAKTVAGQDPPAEKPSPTVLEELETELVRLRGKLNDQADQLLTSGREIERLQAQVDWYRRQGPRQR